MVGRRLGDDDGEVAADLRSGQPTAGVSPRRIVSTMSSMSVRISSVISVTGRTPFEKILSPCFETGRTAMGLCRYLFPLMADFATSTFTFSATLRTTLSSWTSWISP